MSALYIMEVVVKPVQTFLALISAPVTLDIS